jgi:hypothetical protein
MYYQRNAHQYYQDQWKRLRQNLDPSARRMGDELITKKTPTWNQFKMFDELRVEAIARSAIF